MGTLKSMQSAQLTGSSTCEVRNDCFRCLAFELKCGWRVNHLKLKILEAVSGNFSYCFTSLKFLGTEEAETYNSKLVWELQRKTRKFRTPGSPMGPNELVYFESNNNHHQTTKARPLSCHKPMIRSHLQVLDPETRCLDARIPLGLSPSLTIQQVVSRKRISPSPESLMETEKI
ncbi:hypothetical protein DITRI_Ditri07aG0047300 [Diplodiscus trichospermus]